MECRETLAIVLCLFPLLRSERVEWDLEGFLPGPLSINLQECPGRGAQVVGASSPTPNDCGFDPQSGHLPGLQVQSLVGTIWKATDRCFSLTSMSLFLSSSSISNINEHILR